MTERRADDKWRPDLDWNDLVATAWLAFSEAIDNFDPAWNNGLGAYARLWVDGALRRLGRGLHDLGIVDESRAARWLRSHHHAAITPEEVVEAVGGTIPDAQRAIWAEEARRGEKAPHRVPYDSNSEGGYAGAGYERQAELSNLLSDSPGWAAIADDDPDAEPYAPRDDADWENYCHRRATAMAQERPGPRAESFPAPLKSVNRLQYEGDQWWAHRRVSSLSFKERKEVVFRTCVGERILWPIIGGYRPPRGSGEDKRPAPTGKSASLARTEQQESAASAA